MIYNKNIYNSAKYNDSEQKSYTFTTLQLLGPIITLGSQGTSGQVLSSQGGGLPPKWINQSGGLPTLGTALQQLRVNAGGTALEYFTPSSTTLTMGTTTITGGTTGSVLFMGASSVIQQDNANFFWDDTNNVLGIGKNSSFSLQGIGTAKSSLFVKDTTNNLPSIQFENSSANWLLYAGANSTDFSIRSSGSGSPDVISATLTAPANSLRLTSIGVGVGITSPGARLHVKGSGTSSSTSSILLENSAGTEKFRVYDDAAAFSLQSFGVLIGSFVINNSSKNIYYSNDTGGTLTFPNDNLVGAKFNFAGTSKTATNGTVTLLTLNGGFAPTSGTGIYNELTISPTINQIGGANGVTRGIYINPTLTAAADWRALEIANGKFKLTDTYSAGSGSLAGSALDLAATWNTTGNPTAILLNVTNTASGVSSNFIDFQLGGSSQFKVAKFGMITTSAGIILSSAYGINFGNSNGTITSPADGVVLLQNAAASSFGRLQFGGTTAAFPALKRASTALQVRLADDSGFAPLVAADLSLNKTVTAAGTTGAQTINNPIGSVNFAAAATSLVVTNSYVTANSIIIVSVATNDATMTAARTTQTSGSFTIYADMAPTAETRVNFIVIN